MQKMMGDEGSLFPACYLQGAMQLQRVPRIWKSNQVIPAHPCCIGRDDDAGE